MSSVRWRRMTAHPLLVCAAISLLACSCAASPPAPRARDFRTAISRIKRRDPGSPAVLSAQLAYADFLLGAAPGPCAQRLALAQPPLASVEANPEARVISPDALARAAGLEYRLHLERAACDGNVDRDAELLAALAAARRAVPLYRNVFDYHSMVIMQFDTGVVLHQLGEQATALAALEVALDMDREYGFGDDAAQNYELLLDWQGKAAGPAQVAALMRDFPKRRAILKFAWGARDAQITLENRRESIDDGRIFASRAAASFERRISPDHDGSWSVSYLHRLSHYLPGVWPTAEDPHASPVAFAPAALAAVGFKVSASGQFEGVTDSRMFSARLVAVAQRLIRARAPSGKLVHDVMDEAVEATPDVLSPGLLEAATAEDYALQTAMWVGATLEQGVWYEISAPLALPGFPRVVLRHRITFAFTRMVPCSARAAPPQCVEIIIRAAPDRQALIDFSGYPWDPQYAGSIEARIVTDPATLLPYTLEERISWYDPDGRGDALVESDHVVSTAAYRDGIDSSTRAMAGRASR